MEKYNTEKEVWKDIEGYEGLYKVSNFGRVKSLDRKVTRGDGFVSVAGRLIKPALVNGYPLIRLSKNNKIKSIAAHRLVGKAFINNPNNFPQINHKDENKTNNHVSNLEWCTNLYNNNYGTRKKRQLSHLNSVNVGIENRERFRIPVKGTSLKTGEVVYYESMKDATRDGFRVGNISHVCKGNRKSHKGYAWEYL